jgi:hypothetical protein
MAFEVDHIGAVIHVEAPSDAEWRASAQLYAQDRNGQRLLALSGTMSAGGQRRDVENAINQLLGRDPEQHRPPPSCRSSSRLSRNRLAL